VNIQQDFIQLLLLPIMFMQSLWWTQMYIAHKNRTYTKEFKGSYTIFVAVHQEDPALLESCLKSIVAHGKPLEMIVTLNDAPNASERIKTIAAKYATRVIEVAHRTTKREQYALAGEVMRKKPDVIITVNSDTVWDEGTLNILKPFTDELVGAVTGRHIIANPERSWAPHIASWLEDVHCRVRLPFQSYYGQVMVAPGRILAARREAYNAAAQAARTETFAGRRMITGDNTSVTSHIVHHGLRVVYQKNATVTITAPGTMKHLVQRQLTTYRSVLRGFFRYSQDIVRLHPLAALANIAYLFFSFVLLAFTFVFVLKIALRVYEFDTTLQNSPTTVWALPFILIVLLVAAYIHNIPHFLHAKRDALFLPMFALFVLFAGVVLKTIALFSFSENSQSTRIKGMYGGGKVGRARGITTMFGVAVVVVSLLIPYLIAVQPLGVPLTTLINGQGPEYYRAHQLADQLKDGDAHNDPTSSQIITLIQANGFTLGYRVNDDFAPLALPCVTGKLKVSDRKYNDAILKDIDTCYQQVAADPKFAQEKLKPQPKTPQPQIITVHAHEADALTYLIRGQVKEKSSSLGAAQAVFIETTYLAQTNQLNRWLDVGEAVTIDGDELNALIDQANTLGAEELAAWGVYAKDIVW